MRATFTRNAPHSARGGFSDFPAPIQPEHFVEVFVTSSPPSDAALSPPLPSREQGSHFHLHVIAHFTEGTTGVAHPEIVDPSGQRGIDARDNGLGMRSHPHRISRILALMTLRAFSFGVIRRQYPSPSRFRTRRRSNPRNPKASPFSVSTSLVFSRLSSTPSGASCSSSRCHARSAQPHLLRWPLTGMTISSANR